MVAQLLRLRADLLAGTFRGPAVRSMLALLGSLAAVVAAVLVAVAFVALDDTPATTASATAVSVGALITLGCTVVPFVAGAVGGFDPRRFTHFGLTRRQIAVDVGAIGAIGVPALALVIVAVGYSGAWMRSAGIGLLAVLAVVIAVLTALLFVRVTATLGGWLLAASRRRDNGLLVGFVVVVLAIPGISLLSGLDWMGASAAALARFGDIAGWTPWGAAWAVPAEAADGHGGRAVLALAEALVVLAALALAWWALVGRTVTTVEGAASRRWYRGLGWFDRLGSSPVAAVAARSLTYWGRDPRYRMSALVLIFVPIVVVPIGVAGVPWNWTALVPLPLMAIIAGFLPHNDVSADNTAVWLHVASGASGSSDRLGRVVPVLVVGVPAIVVGAFVSAALFGSFDVVPLLIGVAACALFAGLGLSSIVSALLPYPTVRPGDHPFQQPQAAGALAVTAQSIMIVGTLLLTAPAVVVALGALRTSDTGGDWMTFGLGLAVGVVVLALGVVVGGRVFDRHGPDILAAAQRN